MNEPTQTIHAALLPFLGVLRVGGADAARFLQGQLTNDVPLLEDGRTQLAGYNTPQGRVIALLRLHKVDDAIYALLPADLVERVSALLYRFVLRSKVDLQIAADLQVGSITSVAALRDSASTHVVSFDYAPGRRVIAAPPDTWRSIPGLALASDQPRVRDEWLATDIRDGQPQVFAATSEAFIPQMLNLDLIGGISFSKGCYTGQEIVARTQNLGRIKRRTFRYRVDGAAPPPPLAGLHLDGAKVAEVLTSAAWGGKVELLAVTSLEARDRVLTLEDGRSATPADMAYKVP
jgi:folate-binding protein YgfZ